MQRGIARGYDRTARAYDEAARFNRTGARRLVAALPPAHRPDLLDAGCGTGFAALALLDRDPSVRRVTGVDVSAEMLDLFRDKLRAHPGVEARLAVADLLRDPLPEGPYDTVLCGMVLQWLGGRRGEAVARLAGSLRTGGMLAVVAPGPGHDREYVAVLEALRPPPPRPLVDVFAEAEVTPEALAGHMAAAGLEVVDAWVERRVRRVPPEAYMARIEAVGSHTWAEIMSPAEAAALLGRVRAAVGAASPGGAWRYTFTKTYAIGRRAPERRPGVRCGSPPRARTSPTPSPPWRRPGPA